VKKGGQKYILKIFRKQHSMAALQSVSVMNYLKNNDFPVPAIMLTVNGDSYFLTNENDQVAILYEYIDGSEPERKQYLEEIGKLTGHMYKLMERYNGELLYKNKEFFINRYISILAEKKFDGINKFINHGDKLWNRVQNNSLGFCHGDMHTGNMLLRNDKIHFFDFDACGMSHPLYDIATICDGTDYFDLSDRNFEYGMSKTKENLEIYLRGYNNYYCLKESEKRAVFDYIAIRHYDIQATIIECQGLNCVDKEFLNNQYNWLMRWEETCNKLL
jgi:Ser/Thr protein kinase RdoA (MazF antagonist)